MKIQITKILLSHWEALVSGPKDLEAILGRTALPGALLPSDFVAGLMPIARKSPDWIGVWAMSDDHILGSGGFRGEPIDGEVEIGYGVAPMIEGHGVGTAICAGLLEMGFRGGAERIIAHTLPDGFASQKILMRNGFQREGEKVDPEDGLVFRFVRQNPDSESIG